MKDYFILQFKMTNRTLKDFGLNPIIGYSLLLVSFIGLTIFLFSKTEYAQYILILIALSFASKLSETRRNDFLKFCFSNKVYWKLRLLENILVVLPFITFLIYKQLFTSTIILLLLNLFMALVNFNSTFNYTIPTPFYKKPFEFTIGFRSTFYVIIFAYFLTFMAVSVGNFNLGVFAILLIFIISISFYSKLENEYFIWSFIDTPHWFLVKKIKTALVYSTILILPILVVLGIFFLSKVYTLLIILILGYVYLVTIILAKYSAYPNEINLPQAVLIGISLLFPPILIGIIPFFYLQSLKRLNDILL